MLIAIKHVAIRCQDLRLPIFLEMKGILTWSPRRPLTIEKTASDIWPVSIITPTCEAESSTTFIKNRIWKDINNCRTMSLNTFPTAQDNISLLRILDSSFKLNLFLVARLFDNHTNTNRLFRIISPPNHFIATQEQSIRSIARVTFENRSGAGELEQLAC